MSDDVYLHPVEVDLLCTFAEVEPPFPLEIPATGTTEAERLLMFRGAREQLAERGLADEGGPLGLAEDFTHLLRFGTGVLDLFLSQEQATVGAVMLVHRDEALVAVQRPSDPEPLVRVRLTTVDEAVDELMRIVPRLAAANVAPFTLPRKALRSAFDAMLTHLPEEDGVEPRQLAPAEIEELFARHGIDDRVSRRMVQHLQPVLGNGQAGIARRGGQSDEWMRTGEELRWLDTQRGRYQLAGAENADWMSVNPLAPDEIRAGLRKLASALRA